MGAVRKSSGRLSQHKILMSDERIAKHLLETVLFSEASLLKFLNKYSAIAIKPVIGPGEINILSEKKKIQILSISKTTTLTKMEDVYPYLINKELKQKYYIIQPLKLSSRFIKNPFQYYITVHRNSPSNDWFIKSNTEKYHSLFGAILYDMFFFQKIEHLSILATQKLAESYPNCHTVVIEILYDLKGGIWIKDAVLHFRNSKWRQYHTLASNQALTSHLPCTDLLTKCTLTKFLNKYDEIIIKPCVGQEGKGIMKISSNKDQTYEIQAGKMKFLKANIDEIYDFIEQRFLMKKNYLVQQKLSLATINDCPIDIRVVTQKSDSAWIATAMLVKVAGRGYFITNAAQKLLTIADMYKDLNLSIPLEMLENKLAEICISASTQLEKAEQEVKLIGFDIGITNQGDIWIIEGNYVPDTNMFYRLENKEMYMKIKKVINGSS